MVDETLWSEPDGALEILREWSWLVDPDSMMLCRTTALGDALLVERRNRQVLLLDTSAGEIRPIAANSADLEIRLQDPEFASDLLIPDLVAALISAHGQPGRGHCFSPVFPATLGGQYTVANYQIATIQDHFSAYGKLQKQIIPLPLGTKIKAVKLEGE